jgi:hypothetical protein
MPALEIKVFCCPNKKYKGEPPHSSWPTPKDLKLQLKNEERKTPGVFPDTDSSGVTSHNVSAGTYTIELRDNQFKDWLIEPPTVTVGDSAKKHVVRLIPPDGKRMLPLRLCGYDGRGTRVDVVGAEVKDGDIPFRSGADGFVCATAAGNLVTLTFEGINVPGTGWLEPQNRRVKFRISDSADVDVTEIAYVANSEAPASLMAKISIKPTVKTASKPDEPLTGASVTLEYSTPSSSDYFKLSGTLAVGQETISFDNLPPGIYAAAVTPPATFGDWPIDQTAHQLTAERVVRGESAELTAEFKPQKVCVTGRVQTTDGRPVPGDVQLQIYGSGVSRSLTARGGTFSIELDWGVPLQIRVAGNADLSIGDMPLKAAASGQLLSLADTNIVVLEYVYGVEGRAVDEAGNPVPGAVIDVFDEQQQPAGSGVAGPDGSFTVGTTTCGNYYVAAHTVGGEPVTRQLVAVQSMGNAGNVVVPSGPNVRMVRGVTDGATGSDPSPQRDRSNHEALTDLSAYPVLTEEISTTGVPAPAAGGSGGGGPGAGYGQAVEQVMRDVLGWRPSGDVAGFQAALSGAFQLREVEGHTEWSWQQRGYAVQADMGALTGAQASIYARAKNALDQMLPLLAGLTTLNPALYQPQDLEAIRTVVTTELNELVTELALTGGPRIQRVDQLFVLLLGEGQHSLSLDPDLVGGSLGTLRDRFGLTEDNVDTVDEERIVTNFRVIVEQVLALEASWHQDRQLLSGVNARTALGTILIWLSRGLEAVCESVDDLAFALDSVYVDAAQRQVIELRFADLTVDVPDLPLTRNTTTPYPFKPHEAPLLLSDLLDWITRVSRDEGPRIIQDAGKDGVLQFEPQLNKLRILVHAARKVARHGATLPAGMQTPRVSRAFQVLAAQLDEATNLAGLVKREPIPQIAEVTGVTPGPGGTIVIAIAGNNLHRSDTAVLTAANRGDLPELRAVALVPPGAPIARTPTIATATSATATFMDPSALRNTAGTTWMVALIDKNGTPSNQVEAVRVPYQSA